MKTSVLVAALCCTTLAVAMARDQSTEEALRSYPRERTAEGLLIPQPFGELAAWTATARDRGLNCPKPVALYDEGENALGMVWRLKCLSTDAASVWMLKIVWRPGRPALLLPWSP